jgi:hypothetical protein
MVEIVPYDDNIYITGASGMMEKNTNMTIEKTVEKVTLKGSQFTLELNGSLKISSGTYTYEKKGSHEYDGTYQERYHKERFEGEGTLSARTGQMKDIFFRFSTPEAYKPENKTLDDKILPLRKTGSKRIVRKKLLIDHFCRHLLGSLRKQLKDKAKAMRYGLHIEFTDDILDRNEMIALGVLVGDNGQSGKPVAV